jgi:hypothetical protein
VRFITSQKISGIFENYTYVSSRSKCPENKKHSAGQIAIEREEINPFKEGTSSNILEKF